jgi:hypothetical protein
VLCSARQATNNERDGQAPEGTGDGGEESEEIVISNPQQ